jgi:hypothetical protein
MWSRKRRAGFDVGSKWARCPKPLGASSLQDVALAARASYLEFIGYWLLVIAIIFFFLHVSCYDVTRLAHVAGLKIHLGSVFRKAFLQ